MRLTSFRLSFKGVNNMKLIDAIKDVNKVKDYAETMSGKLRVIVYDGISDVAFIMVGRQLQAVMKEQMVSKVNVNGQHDNFIDHGFIHIPLTITQEMANSYAWGVEVI
jgi:hypothetical protein